jgi:lipoprotein-releasing system permease protein
VTVTTEQLASGAGAAPPPSLPSPRREEGRGRARRLPRVFAFSTFACAAAGVLGAPVAFGLCQVFLQDRLGLPSGAADGLAILAGASVAGLLGAVGAALGRRLGFYEIALATLVLLAILLGPLRWAMPALRSTALAVASWEAQGGLVLVLGLLLTALASGTAAFAGSSAGYLLFGSGRLDASMSYELFVAKSHLRLQPRTMAALFLLVVTGIAPGLLFALARAVLRDSRERRAAARGEIAYRQRMPATMLMTLISIGGVAIGVWALTVVLSVMSGFEGDLKSKILGTRAHGVVTKYGQNDFTEWRQVRKEVLAVKGIVGAAPFLYAEGMVSAGQNLTGVVMEGIDPQLAGQVVDLPRTIQDGEIAFLSHPERIPVSPIDEEEGRPGKRQGDERAGAGAQGRVLPGIAIGRELSRILRVEIGETVNVINPLGDLGPAGPQPKSRPFRVAAIFYTGMYEYDSKFAYLALAEAQRFFGAGDSVTGLEVRVRNVDAARPILRRVLAALEGFPYRVKDWGEMNRSLFSALMTEKVVMAIILAFIVLVASFIIVATLIMQVLDKRREIAVLKSMGAGQSSVMKIFVAEGLVIGAVGTAFGLLLGLGTCFLIDKVGIPLDPEVYYISSLPVRMDPVEFALVALLALALSYLATIYPASKASRLEPVEGLRSE